MSAAQEPETSPEPVKETPPPGTPVSLDAIIDAYLEGDMELVDMYVAKDAVAEAWLHHTTTKVNLTYQGKNFSVRRGLPATVILSDKLLGANAMVEIARLIDVDQRDDFLALVDDDERLAWYSDDNNDWAKMILGLRSTLIAVAAGGGRPPKS
jgi:hypothetical protein